MRKQERYKYVLDYLAGTWNETETELNYSNNFELLVAVVLSAQCTDKRINQITPRLFADYPTPEAMSLATPEVLYDYIKTVSYPKRSIWWVCPRGWLNASEVRCRQPLKN